MDITKFSPHSGQYIKDDGSVVNLADKIEAIYNALVVNKDAGIDVIDRTARVLGKISADDAAITALGAMADAAKTDPAQAASVIALLKGLLTGAGAKGDTLVTDPAQAASQIALLKGLLKILADVWDDPNNALNMKLTGSLTAITHSVLTVTTTSQQALAANPDRKYAMLINDSDTVIYIKIGAPAVVGEGIRLNPNGGSYEMSSAIGNLHTGAINAIHGGTGNKNLLVLEGV
jgi:hypothetical protein